MAIVEETIDYLESDVFPRLAQSWRTEQSTEAGSGEQILPHRLPLKRRLAEYRFSTRRPAVPGLSLSSTSASGPSASTTTTSSSSSASAFLPHPSNLWALERFRDITPALVVAVFEEGIVLEPGDVGPLPMSHPVTREIVQAINRQRLGLAMLEKLREAGAPLYDGCAVVGIVDYRRWAFYHNSTVANGGSTSMSVEQRPTKASSSSSSSSTTTTTNTNTTATGPPKPKPDNGEEMAGKRVASAPVSMTPEMHKILLRPDDSTLICDLYRNILNQMEDDEPPPDPFEVEAKLLLATSGPLCLDPNPMVSRVLTSLTFNAKKFNGVPERLFRAAQRQKEALEATQGSHGRHEEILKLPRIEAFLRRHRLHVPTAAHGALPMQKFRLLSTVEQLRTQNAQIGAEPMYGLDARKDPGRLGLTAPPPLTWLQSGMSLWRTLRFEDRPAVVADDPSFNDAPVIASPIKSPAIKHYTVHIVMQQQGSRGIRFEAILRIGRGPCLGDVHDRHRHPPLRLSLTSRPLLDAHLDQLRRTMQIEGKHCVADVSNPNALAALVRQGAELGYSSPMGVGVARGVPAVFGARPAVRFGGTAVANPVSAMHHVGGPSVHPGSQSTSQPSTKHN